MKEIWKDWRFWAVIVALALVITAVILYFVAPKFCYFVSGLLIGAFGGFIGGYCVCKKYGVCK